jgi:hypothetical protein
MSDNPKSFNLSPELHQYMLARNLEDDEVCAKPIADGIVRERNF